MYAIGTESCVQGAIANRYRISHVQGAIGTGTGKSRDYSATTVATVTVATATVALATAALATAAVAVAIAAAAAAVLHRPRGVPG